MQFDLYDRAMYPNGASKLHAKGGASKIPAGKRASKKTTLFPTKKRHMDRQGGVAVCNSSLG